MDEDRFDPEDEFDWNEEQFDPNEENELHSKDQYTKELLDEKLLDIFRNYYIETGNYVNWGIRIKSDFFNHIDDRIKRLEIELKQNLCDENSIIKEEIQNLTKLRELSKEINKNEVIKKCIIEKIKNSSLNAKEISTEFEEFYLQVSYSTVRNIALNDVFHENIRAHQERFPVYPENKVSELLISNEFFEYDYRDLLNVDIKEIFEEYRNQSGKYPNYGTEITEEFFKWYDKHFSQNKDNIKYFDKIIDLKNKIRSINTNHEISKLIVDKIQHTNLSQDKISGIIKEFSLSVSRSKIKKIGQDLVYFNNAQKYHNRFKPKKDWIPKEKEENILEILRKETRNETPKKLIIIAKENNVSHIYLYRLVRKHLNEELYKQTWPATQNKINDELRQKIKEDILDISKNLTMTEISEKYDLNLITIRNISVNDLQEENPFYNHETRFPKDIPALVGDQVHYRLKEKLTRFTQFYFNKKYYSEPQIFPDSRKRPDGLILNENNFLLNYFTNSLYGKLLAERMEINLKSIEHIKAVQIDFTSDTTYKNIVNKVVNYQTSDTLLFIVGTRWYEHRFNETAKIPKDDDIRYSENIKVISHDLFADFLGLLEKDKEEFDEIIEASYNYDIDSLRIMQDKDILPHFTDELKKDLIDNGLIEQNFCEYFDMDNNNTESNITQIGRQLKLKEFMKKKSENFRK